MKIFNHTKTKLSPADALRALFGKAIHIHTEIEASGTVEVLGSTSTTYVDELFPRKQPTAQAMAPAAPYCNGQCGICSCIPSPQPQASQARDHRPD